MDAVRGVKLHVSCPPVRLFLNLTDEMANFKVTMIEHGLPVYLTQWRS